MKKQMKIENKLQDFHFTNEHGNSVSVIGIVNEWCVVEEDGKTKPYLLEKEFVQAIYDDFKLSKNPKLIK